MEKVAKEIKDMNYSDLVALVKERNRPSGGLKTIHTVAINAFINQNKRMLEIGCNTGFTSVNMALLTGCKCIGIDINEDSLKEAKNYAKKQGIQDKVTFIKANAERLPFRNEFFDIVWCSNVTSFIKNKEKAIKEYLRVLKLGGTLVAVPIYYIKTPPKLNVSKISKAIGAEVKVWDKNFWTNLFEKIAKESKIWLELYYSKDFIYENRSKFIKSYLDEVFDKPHLINLSEDLREKIKKRYSYFINLFNENLKYAGFSILLYQKRNIKDETELFLTKEK